MQRMTSQVTLEPVRRAILVMNGNLPMQSEFMVQRTKQGRNGLEVLKSLQKKLQSARLSCANMKQGSKDSNFVQELPFNVSIVTTSLRDTDQ